MRLMQMERELQYVRSDRDRLKLYLERILKEVDQKVQHVLLHLSTHASGGSCSKLTPRENFG